VISSDPGEHTAVARRKTKGTWGGARPGAGRKPLFKDPVRFTLDLEREDLDTLQAMADEAGVTLTEMLRRAVAAQIKRRRRP
jgi:hypothetical protein